MTRAWRLPLLLLLLAVVVRICALGVAAAGGRFPDFWEPEILARNLLAGRGYVYPELNNLYRAYMEPLYPGLVAAVYLVTGGSAVALALVQCVVSALTAPAVYAFTRRTFDESSAIVAGLLVCVNPGLAGYAVKFHPLALDALLLVLVALTLLQLAQEPTGARGLLFGLALGACVLTRPTVLVFVVVATVGLAVSVGGRFTRHAVLGVVVAALIVAPWVIRNYRALDTFVLTRTNTGYVFWLGNHPGTSGGAADRADPTSSLSQLATAPAELQRRVLSAGEVEQNRILFTEALRYVREEPVAFMTRWVRKLAYFWWFPPYGGKRYPGWQLRVYQAFYALLLAAALTGVIRAARAPSPGHHPGLALAILLPLGVGAAQALFYIEGRHRLAVEPMLAVPAGYGLAWLHETLRRPRTPLLS